MQAVVHPTEVGVSTAVVDFIVVAEDSLTVGRVTAGGVAAIGAVGVTAEGGIGEAGGSECMHHSFPWDTKPTGGTEPRISTLTIRISDGRRPLGNT